MKSHRHWRNRETRPAGWTDQDSRSPSRRTKIFARIELIQAWMEGEESKGFAELFLHLGNFAELGQSGSFVRIDRGMPFDVHPARWSYRRCHPRIRAKSCRAGAQERERRDS